MSDLEHVLKWVNRGETCASCGTDLKWHLQNVKRASVYLAVTDEFFCCYKCLREANQRSSYIRFTGLKEGID
jgi:hypothetical protein